MKHSLNILENLNWKETIFQHGNQREGTLKPETLAYIAGVMDSDGCLTIFRTLPSAALLAQRRRSIRYQAQAVVVNTNLDIMDLLNTSYPGSLKQRKKAKSHHKRTYAWRIGDLKMVPFLEAIRPYLVAKRRQCDILILFRRSMEESKGIFHGKLTPKPILEFREWCWTEIRRLNQVGAPPATTERECSLRFEEMKRQSEHIRKIVRAAEMTAPAREAICSGR